MVGDLRDAAVLDAALASRPDTIFHLAARTSVLQSVKDPQGVYDVNVAVTQRLLEGAREVGARSFVFASTNAVAGETDGARIDETTPMRPLTPYGATKAAAEMLCSAYASSYGVAACAIRFTNVYGRGMGGKDTFVVRLMRAAAADRPISVYGDGLQERDYLYVDDAVAAMLRARARGTARAADRGYRRFHFGARRVPARIGRDRDADRDHAHRPATGRDARGARRHRQGPRRSATNRASASSTG